MRRYPARAPILAIEILMMLSFLIRYPANAQPQPDLTRIGSPLRMRLCVGTDCQTLIWRGAYYDGVKENASDILAHYEVEQWSPSEIRFRGKSVSPIASKRQNVGPISIPSHTHVEGLFSGSISADGQSVRDGIVRWQVGKQTGEKVFTLTWKQDSGGATVSASCSEGPALNSLPAALEICDGPCILNSNGNTGAWMFEGKKGTAVWVKGSRANLLITQWDRSRVTIVREDTPNSASAGVTATYKGQVCGATVKGEAVVNWPGHAENATMPWTATIPVTNCEGLGDDPLRLEEIAQTALRFRQLPSAFVCLSRAADLGDMQARTATGLMYRDGIGTKVNFPEAKARFQQSAIQGDYNAELALSQMYDLGLGVPENPAKAIEWKARALDNPVKVAERQRASQQANTEKLAFLGLAALVEAMAQPEVYVVR